MSNMIYWEIKKKILWVGMEKKQLCHGFLSFTFTELHKNMCSINEILTLFCSTIPFFYVLLLKKSYFCFTFSYSETDLFFHRQTCVSACFFVGQAVVFIGTLNFWSLSITFFSRRPVGTKNSNKVIF